MTPPLPPTPDSLVARYLHAKDENRPYLMPGVFAADATLAMDVRTGAIAFPPASRGLDAITEVLVRNFGRTYENIYTFCLQRPTDEAARTRVFSCDWLVGMSEKSSGAVRVGCGRYDWRFAESVPLRVSRLVITIDAMEVLPPDTLGAVMAWVSALPYPWCPPGTAVRGAPPVAALSPVLQRLSAVAGTRTG